MLAEKIIAAVLADGNVVRFEATGDSMYPTICWGDRLLIESVEVRDLRAGDVVLARLERGLTAHRVVVVGRTITTRGDNCDADDPPFAADQLMGRVRSIEREGRPLGTRRTLWSRVRRAINRLRRAAAPSDTQ